MECCSSSLQENSYITTMTTIRSMGTKATIASAPSRSSVGSVGVFCGVTAWVACCSATATACTLVETISASTTACIPVQRTEHFQRDGMKTNQRAINQLDHVSNLVKVHFEESRRRLSRADADRHVSSGVCGWIPSSPGAPLDEQ